MTENATRDIAALLRERVVPPGGSRHGLVVGIERYRDTRLNLRCAAADAKAIFDLMTDPDCGMFPKENVRLLLNEEATRDGIWRSLSALRRSAGENDTVWMYYSGHAAPEGSNVYWVTHDADVDDLYGTGLSSDQISKVLDDIRARRLLVLLDSCHAAATAAQKNPTRAILTADELLSCFKGHGRITLSSSDGKEKSVELGDLGHGAFTYFLERGLRGEADADGDGVVTADELWSYLRSKVVDASQKAGNPQTPVLLGELRHDFALSLNPLEFGRRRRIAETVRSLVGVGADQLTTEEGRICLELLRRDARNAAERDLMAEFASLLEGRLRISTLRRLIDDVSETAAMRERLHHTAGTQPVPPTAHLGSGTHQSPDETDAARAFTIDPRGAATRAALRLKCPEIDWDSLPAIPRIREQGTARKDANIRTTCEICGSFAGVLSGAHPAHRQCPFCGRWVITSWKEKVGWFRRERKAHGCWDATCDCCKACAAVLKQVHAPQFKLVSKIRRFHALDEPHEGIEVTRVCEKCGDRAGVLSDAKPPPCSMLLLWEVDNPRVDRRK